MCCMCYKEKGIFCTNSFKNINKTSQRSSNNHKNSKEKKSS